MKPIYIVKIANSNPYYNQVFDEIPNKSDIAEWLRDGSLQEGDIIYEATPIFVVDVVNNHRTIKPV